MLKEPFLTLLSEVLPQLEQSFAHLPSRGEVATPEPAAQKVLAEVAGRLADNYPYQHPLYAGQMMKPPHPVARAAYAMAMGINPNNHALDGGRASSRMETEAVREIAGMFGWSSFLGHLTSGGTFANLEALWVAGRLAPGKRVLASDQAHYTHNRISGVLQLPFASVRSDNRARMDLNALEEQLRKGDVGTVVVTLGTTATGSVDPLDGVLQLREKYGFRVHVDAAYGGYYRLLAKDLDSAVRRAYEQIREADSCVIDPHKHGLQPYGCGCVLFRDPTVGRFYKHDSPYTYFSSNDLHLGEISLECSRAGAAAVALWATQRLFPLKSEGEFAQGLSRCRDAAQMLYNKIESDNNFVPAFCPELDIVVWTVKAGSVEESSRLSQQVFDHAAAHDLHLALVQLPARFFRSEAWPDVAPDQIVTGLRSVLMKPEHKEWLEIIWERLQLAVQESY